MTTKKIFEIFDAAAKYHGWAEDEGTAREARDAEEAYKKAKTRLLKRLTGLEAAHKAVKQQGNDI